VIDILVVDDEAAIAKLIKFVLETNGWAVRTASDGNQALDEIKSKVPDLMVLDLMLPTISGFEVLEKLRVDHSGSPFPVVVLTCKGQKEDRDKAFGLGAREYITKPFSPNSLVNVLKTFLQPAS
jgi:DNA-binding response OmpR family regulator